MFTIFDALGVGEGEKASGPGGRPTRPRPPCGGRTVVSTGPCPAGTSGSTCTGPPINATRDGNGWSPEDITAGSGRWVLMAIVVTQQNRNVCSLLYFNNHFVAPIRCMIVKLQCILLMSFFTFDSFGGLPPDNEYVALWYSFLIRPIFLRAGSPFPLGGPGPAVPPPAHLHRPLPPPQGVQLGERQRHQLRPPRPSCFLSISTLCSFFNSLTNLVIGSDSRRAKI